MGILPIWGLQMITAVIISKFARLNIPLVLVAANISIAPLIPPIIYLSLLIGTKIMGTDTELLFSFQLSPEDIKLKLTQYVVGSIILAVTTGLLFGILSYFFFKKYTTRNKAPLTKRIRIH